MTDVINYLAEAQELPLEESPSVLLPASYDIVWSLVVLVIVSILFKKFVLPKYREVLTEREDRIKGAFSVQRLHRLKLRQLLKSTMLSSQRHEPKQQRSVRMPAQRASRSKLI